MENGRKYVSTWLYSDTLRRRRRKRLFFDDGSTQCDDGVVRVIETFSSIRSWTTSFFTTNNIWTNEFDWAAFRKTKNFFKKNYQNTRVLIETSYLFSGFSDLSTCSVDFPGRFDSIARVIIRGWRREKRREKSTEHMDKPENRHNNATIHESYNRSENITINL